MDVPTEQDTRRFLARFPDDAKSQTCNVFLSAVRSGHTTPLTVLAAVGLELERRLQSPYREPKILQLHKLISYHNAEAVDMARWAIEWEQMTPKERRRIKAERTEQYRDEYMGTVEPTEKQLTYLRALGHTGPVESRKHASQLIDQLKRASA